MATGVSAPDPLYTRDILRLAANVPGRLAWDELDARELRAPVCGSRLKMIVEEEGGRVTGVRQALEACAFGQAAAALAAAGAIGRQRADLIEIDQRVAAWLAVEGEAPWPGLDVLEPARTKAGRHGAILLPFRALARWAQGDEA